MSVENSDYIFSLILLNSPLLSTSYLWRSNLTSYCFILCKVCTKTHKKINLVCPLQLLSSLVQDAFNFPLMLIPVHECISSALSDLPALFMFLVYFPLRCKFAASMVFALFYLFCVPKFSCQPGFEPPNIRYFAGGQWGKKGLIMIWKGWWSSRV